MGKALTRNRKAIIDIMYDELENQPMASQKVKDKYSWLSDIFEEYVNAVQEDAFYFGYLTAVKQYEKA